MGGPFIEVRLLTPAMDDSTLLEVLDASVILMLLFFRKGETRFINTPRCFDMGKKRVIRNCSINYLNWNFPKSSIYKSTLQKTVKSELGCADNHHFRAHNRAGYERKGFIRQRSFWKKLWWPPLRLSVYRRKGFYCWDCVQPIEFMTTVRRQTAVIVMSEQE